MNEFEIDCPVCEHELTVRQPDSTETPYGKCPNCENEIIVVYSFNRGQIALPLSQIGHNATPRD